MDTRSRKSICWFEISSTNLQRWALQTAAVTHNDCWWMGWVHDLSTNAGPWGMMKTCNIPSIRTRPCSSRTSHLSRSDGSSWEGCDSITSHCRLCWPECSTCSINENLSTARWLRYNTAQFAPVTLLPTQSDRSLFPQTRLARHTFGQCRFETVGTAKP